MFKTRSAYCFLLCFYSVGPAALCNAKQNLSLAVGGNWAKTRLPTEHQTKSLLGLVLISTVNQIRALFPFGQALAGLNQVLRPCMLASCTLPNTPTIFRTLTLLSFRWYIVVGTSYPNAAQMQPLQFTINLVA
jgi:hypothetical protein